MEWASWLCRVRRWNSEPESLDLPPSPNTCHLCDLGQPCPLWACFLLCEVAMVIVCTSRSLRGIHALICINVLRTCWAQSLSYLGVHSCFTLGNVICAPCFLLWMFSVPLARNSYSHNRQQDSVKTASDPMLPLLARPPQSRQACSCCLRAFALAVPSQ